MGYSLLSPLLGCTLMDIVARTSESQVIDDLGCGWVVGWVNDYNIKISNLE